MIGVPQRSAAPKAEASDSLSVDDLEGDQSGRAVFLEQHPPGAFYVGQDSEREREREVDEKVRQKHRVGG